MAVYDPPQPLWKRNVAGILDFLLALFVFGFVFAKIFGNPPGQKVVVNGAAATEMIGLSGPALLFTVIAVVAYFFLMGRTGGTVFQRVFGMKRAS